MGRKCHKSIGKTLPNRENVILTRDINMGNWDVHKIGALQEYNGIRYRFEVYKRNN